MKSAIFATKAQTKQQDGHAFDWNSYKFSIVCRTAGLIIALIGVYYIFNGGAVFINREIFNDNIPDGAPKFSLTTGFRCFFLLSVLFFLLLRIRALILQRIQQSNPTITEQKIKIKKIKRIKFENIGIARMTILPVLLIVFFLIAETPIFKTLCCFFGR